MKCPFCQGNVNKITEKPRMFIEPKDDTAKDLAIKLMDEYACDDCKKTFFV